MQIKAPKGCRDIYGVEAGQLQYLERVYYDLAKKFGFQEIRVPTFEQTELFQRGVGETTDIVNKEMYTFEDKGGRSMTLRPEGTAPVVRAYLEHGMANLPSPLKLFYSMNVFRYERPQKGRYREFQQFGMELIGASGALAEAEILSFLDSFFKKLGLVDYQLALNSLGCNACRSAYNEKLKDYLVEHSSELCPDCVGRSQRNPLRCLDCKNPNCAPVLNSAPLPADLLCSDCQAEFTKLLAALDQLGINYYLAPRLVRGLDYYTGTVFEFQSDKLGAQTAILGGGRYDKLIAELGGEPTPAVGYAFGVERLRLELEAGGLLPEFQPRADLSIVSFADTGVEALVLANNLRAAGLVVDCDLMGRSFKAQMKQANRQGARYLLVLGTDELQAEEVEIKRLSDGSTAMVLKSEITKYIKQSEEANGR
ncbi:MAG: histidine--tRNA ligase [Eubacteriales bacterium]|nr:histidine--tRNA ligase [Eubacteriales bacterium]